MNIQITTRHFNGSQELQNRIRDEVKRLTRFNDSITAVHVILDAEKKNVRRAEILVNIYDKNVVAQAKEENMHKAVEAVLLKVERQLKKEKEKLKGHRTQSIAELVRA